MKLIEVFNAKGASSEALDFFSDFIKCFDKLTISVVDPMWRPAVVSLLKQHANMLKGSKKTQNELTKHQLLVEITAIRKVTSKNTQGECLEKFVDGFSRMTKEDREADSIVPVSEPPSDVDSADDSKSQFAGEEHSLSYHHEINGDSGNSACSGIADVADGDDDNDKDDDDDGGGDGDHENDSTSHQRSKRQRVEEHNLGTQHAGDGY